MTGNAETDVIIFALAVFGFTVLVAQEWTDNKDKRRWRKK